MEGRYRYCFGALTTATRLTAFSHGAGCACKLSPDDLGAIIGPLRDHPATSSPHLLVGMHTSDDAGVWGLPSGETLVQTVDYFTPIVDDAYDWGRIAAANALSDVYAMGGTPITALQLVSWPRTGLPFELLGEVLQGGADIMASSGTTIVGGHSIDDSEPKYGFAVTGLVPRDGVMTNAGARPGDRLIMTKPLGIGVITTALKRGVCPPELAEAAVMIMTTLNADAVGPMQKAGVRAATDITGFGLLGHLREMAIASGVGAVIDVTAVPVLEGVRRTGRSRRLPRRQRAQPRLGQIVHHHKRRRRDHGSDPRRRPNLGRPFDLGARRPIGRTGRRPRRRQGPWPPMSIGEIVAGPATIFLR